MFTKEELEAIDKLPYLVESFNPETSETMYYIVQENPLVVRDKYGNKYMKMEDGRWKRAGMGF